MRKTIVCMPTNHEILLGVSQYLRVHHPDYVLRSMGRDGYKDLLHDASGIVAHLPMPSRIEMLKGIEVPYVNTSARVDLPDIPSVNADDQRLTEMAIDHFYQQGYRHFACVTRTWELFCRRREDAFKQIMTERNLDGDVFCRDGYLSVPKLRRELLDWVRSLPKPLALIGTVPDIAVEVLYTLVRYEFKIPQEIAVISLDDMPVICESLSPTLSAVPIPWQRMGYKAVELLFEYMEGEREDTVHLKIDPTHLLSRQSSDYFAVDDPLLREGLRLIAENIHQSWNVDDLLNALAVSRSVLQARFQTLLGRSPLQEIHRQRVERAKLLLRETTMPVTSIATQCGFNNKVRFAATFRKWTGMTASEYRNLVE